MDNKYYRLLNLELILKGIPCEIRSPFQVIFKASYLCQQKSLRLPKNKPDVSGKLGFFGVLLPKKRPLVSGRS